MLTGALIILGAILIWSLGFEIYARNAEKDGVIDEKISLVTLTLDNTTLNLEGTGDESLSYSFTRSGALEWKMYGEELRLQARGGILNIRVPENLDLQSIHISNSKEDIYISGIESDEIEISTDGSLVMQDVDAKRAKLEIASGDISSSEFDLLLMKASEALDITETDMVSSTLIFASQDCTILGGSIGDITASSSEGCLEIEPENGIFTITVTGGASTIFIDSEDTSSQSYRDDENPNGARIKFTSPTGSVKTC